MWSGTVFQNGQFLAQTGGVKRTGGYIAAILHTLLWAALFAILFVRTAPDLCRDIGVSSIGPIDPNRSIEPYFRGLTGIDYGPQHLGDIFEYLPRGKTVLIFVRADSGKTRTGRDVDVQSELRGLLVGDFCWRR